MYLYSDLSSAGSVDVGTLGLYVAQGNSLYTVVYSQLNYDKTFGNHHINALLGTQQEQNKDQFLSAFRREYASNLVQELDAGSAEGMNNSGTASEWAIRSYYGRLNYDYKGKYLLGLSTRYDGTSRLPTDTRWGLFYAVSGGWRISEEAFLKDVSWLTDLKLRGSWGRLGNQNIGTYPYQNVLTSTAYPFGSSLTTGYYAGGLVDPSLTWETTQTLDFGLDASLLNGRLNITADWYDKQTFNILRSYQVPLYVGLGAPTVNNGRVKNTGFELDIQYQDKITDDLSYKIGGNIQTYKNTLVQYGAREIGGNTIREEGRPLDEFYLYQWDGIFQNQAEIDNSPTQPITPKPGDLKIKDVNGDGKIDANDRTYTPGRYPIASYNFNVGATWKNFDLSAQVFGSFGQKIYVTGWE
jgi:TonB-linked SusC/RagA family outer membrane protein